MGFSATTYAASKKYTNDSLIGIGALKGAPCKVKSVETINDQVVVTLTWQDDLGNTHDTEVYIQQGTPIYEWKSGMQYNYGDLAIYTSCFYRCVISNNDILFDNNKWVAIGSADSNYSIVETEADLPMGFTAIDRKIYFVINEGVFYLWNGINWTPQGVVPTISIEEIDALFG